MKLSQLIEAAKKHPAIKRDFTVAQIEAIVKKYFSRIDFTATSSPTKEIEHMISAGYFNIA